jgi:hypothetical protein
METYALYILAQMAALCLKLFHLKDKTLTLFTLFMGKGWKGMVGWLVSNAIL